MERDIVAMSQRERQRFHLLEMVIGGKMTFTITETVFCNQREEKVIVTRSTGIHTSQVVED